MPSRKEARSSSIRPASTSVKSVSSTSRAATIESRWLACASVSRHPFYVMKEITSAGSDPPIKSLRSVSEPIPRTSLEFLVQLSRSRLYLVLVLVLPKTGSNPMKTI